MRRELSEDSSVSGSETFISRILFFLAASSATKVDSLTVLCKDIAHLLQHTATSLLFYQRFTEVTEVLSCPHSSISTTTFLGCDGKSLVMSSSLGQPHRTKPFNYCTFLSCRTELGGVNKSHLCFALLQLKCSIFHKNHKPEQSSL